jgi:hypothetical protein
MSDEIKGISEILDSKTAQKVYDDGLKSSVSETGSAITDLVKTARIFTAPIQIAAAYQDRLAAWIDRTIRKVPEERLVKAPARIAGPIFEELRYLEDGDVITEMFLSLLTKAIDKEEQKFAHPGFVKIIGHLSPDEALILSCLKKRTYDEHYESLYDPEKNIFHSKEIILQEFEKGDLIYPENFYVYTSHLTSLDLVRFNIYNQTPTWDEQKGVQKGEIGKAKLELTEFGSMFVSACLPDVT